MATQDFLIELGTEELPPAALTIFTLMPPWKQEICKRHSANCLVSKPSSVCCRSDREQPTLRHAAWRVVISNLADRNPKQQLFHTGTSGTYCLRR